MNLFENLQLMKENDVMLNEGKPSVRMTQKGQPIQNYEWAKYPNGTYVRMFSSGPDASKCGIKCNSSMIAGKVKATYVYNADAAKEMGLNGYKDDNTWVNDPGAPQSCLIEIHPDFKVKQNGQSTERIMIPADFLTKISEQDYKDIVNRIPRKGFDKLINKNKKRIESKVTENTELRPFTGTDHFAWGGVHNFADNSKPLIVDGDYATILVGQSDEQVGTGEACVSIYYGDPELDNPHWGFRCYDDKTSAVKDAKILAKLVDDEIDEAQLNRFGFELVM